MRRRGRASQTPMSRLRILLTTTGHAGHVLPLVPFARAWQRAGHEVLVAAPRERTGVVEQAGLPLLTFEEPAEDEVGPIWAETIDATPDTATARRNHGVLGMSRLRHQAIPSQIPRRMSALQMPTMASNAQ